MIIMEEELVKRDIRIDKLEKDIILLKRKCITYERILNALHKVLDAGKGILKGQQ